MNDRSLQKALQKRDERAMALVVDRYGPVAKGVIGRVLWGHPDLREDALNETFLAIWLHIDAFDPARSSLANWIAGVARYKALDLLRREGAQASLPYLEGADEGARDESPAELEGLLEELLAPLSAADRALFRSLFYEGEDYDAVAGRLGVSKGSLYNRVARGRRRLSKGE